MALLLCKNDFTRYVLRYRGKMRAKLSLFVFCRSFGESGNLFLCQSEDGQESYSLLF